MYFSALAADFHRRREVRNRGLLQTASHVVSALGLHALIVYRFGKALSQLPFLLRWTIALPLWPLYALLAAYVRAGYGIHISLAAEIGPGFYIGHMGGIRIGPCRIGPHCSIGQCTQIGSDGTLPGPVVESRVWIGAHSQILGNWRICQGATIGPGSIVERNVAARTLVMGRPLRVVEMDYDNRHLL